VCRIREVYGAWVNTDGFTLGEKNKAEIVPMRSLATGKLVTVFEVWPHSDYLLRKTSWDERFRWGPNNAEDRIGGMRFAPFTVNCYKLDTRSYPVTWKAREVGYTLHHRPVHEHAFGWQVRVQDRV
jgi:hypothetical protein